MTYTTPDDVIRQAGREWGGRYIDIPEGKDYYIPEVRDGGATDQCIRAVAPVIARAALKAARDKVHWYVEHLLASGEVHGAELIITLLDEMIGDEQ